MKVKQVIEQKKWKYLFFGASFITLVLLLIVSTRVGVTGDEYLDGLNGEYSLKYYTEHDTTFADYSQVEELKPFPHLKYYGSGFEILPAIATHYLHLPEAHIYTFRHLLCAFYGFLLIFFTALTMMIITDTYSGAILTLAVMALTPTIFGLSFFATKDIPFAAGFAIANFAFLSIFKNLPKFKIFHVFLAILGTAIAVSIRIGGLMLALYLLILFILTILFDKEKRNTIFARPYTTLYKSLCVGVGIILLGSLIGLSFYPNFFYEGPIDHIKNALTVVSKFPQRIPMLFDGKSISSLEMPENYLIRSFLYTIPIPILCGILLFFISFVFVFKKYNKAGVLYAICTFLIPVCTILILKSNIYNGWRHVTFAYSGLAIVAALGLYEFIQWFSKQKFYKIWRFAAPIILISAFIPTIVWMVKNDRYIYAYYNTIAGDPYLRFDQDYYETSVTTLLEWLVNNEIKDRTDTVHISVKNHNGVDYQEKKKFDKITVETKSLKSFAETETDYSILTIHFMQKKFIKDFFPPKGTIKVETIDGKPIAAVVKRNKLDSEGIRLLIDNKYEEGMKLMDSAYKYDPNNFGLYFWMGYGYFNLKEYEKSIEFFKKSEFYDLNQDQLSTAKMYTGVSQYELNQYDEAVKNLLFAERINNNSNTQSYIQAHIGLSYSKNKQYKEAIPYLEKATGTYPFLRQEVEIAKREMGK